jgi:hypothetical protein
MGRAVFTDDVDLRVKVKPDGGATRVVNAEGPSAAARLRPAPCGGDDVAARWRPRGEVARRFGHSVEVLVSTYVGALQGDDTRVEQADRHHARRTLDQIVVAATRLFPRSCRAVRRKSRAKVVRHRQRRSAR